MIKNHHHWNRYIKFIEYCRRSGAVGYTEEHHIVPRSEGGGEGDNLIRLSARCHYLAHWMLMKALKTSAAYNAFQMMCQCEGIGQIRRYRVNSKAFAYATEMQAKAHRERMTGEGNPRYGVKLTEEFKRQLGVRISEATKGKPKSEGFKSMMSDKLKGIPKSEAHKAALRVPKSLTEEQRKACGERLKRIPKKVCPECGKEITQANYNRHRKAKHGIS